MSLVALSLPVSYQMASQSPIVTLIASLICYEPGKHRLIISPFAATVNQSLKLG
jgi:hypothetical protein